MYIFSRGGRWSGVREILKTDCTRGASVFENPGCNAAHRPLSEKQCYLATLSSHLTIDNITIIDAAIAPTNTSQHAQIGTFM